MLKFNTFPPKKAGDVVLTELGKRTIKKVVDLEGDDPRVQRNKIFAMGNVAGQVIAESITARDEDEAVEIVAPVVEQVLNEFGNDVYTHFRIGAGAGILEYLDLAELKQAIPLGAGE